MTQHHKDVKLRTLFWIFLKIGSTTFGGFMALISVVQNDVVERRRLLAHEEMLDGISLATILPGAVAFNVVAYVGYKLRGAAGAVICTCAVALPTFLLIVTLSYFYFTLGEIPVVSAIFYGFIPAVAAIIVVAVWNMGRTAISGAPELIISVVACLLLLLVGGFLATLAVVAASGVAGYLLFRGKQPVGSTIPSDGQVTKPKPTATRRLYGVTALPVVYAAVPLFSTDLLLAGKVMMTFAGMSLLLFGGGFVFIPLIQEIVVGHHGWVTQKEFIDGIALGQVMPGPIVMSAAFIGYKVAGLLGAIAATLGIFVPPAVVMVIGSRYLEQIKHAAAIMAGLRGIRAAVVGMILAAAYVVAMTAQHNGISLLIFALALTALAKFKVEVAWVMPLAGLMGVALY